MELLSVAGSWVVIETCQYLDALIGDSWRTAGNLEDFLEYRDNEEVLNQLQEIRQKAVEMVKFCWTLKIQELNADSIIDVQVKRFHSKRQQMLLLIWFGNILILSLDAKASYYCHFGDKAAPAYVAAQISFMQFLFSSLIASDADVSPYLRSDNDRG